MRLATWNLNHRARRKAVLPAILAALAALAADVVVLTEYVPARLDVRNEERETFLAGLPAVGLHYMLLSPRATSGNHVLVASRHPLVAGEIRPPASLVESAPCMSSNTHHVHLPDQGFEILGMRVPDYSKQPPVRRACWDWLVETAKTAARRPFVLIGDFNVDPKYPRARCGDRLAQLEDAGFHPLAPPPDQASYWPHRGDGVRLDHAFASGHFTHRSASYVKEVRGNALAGQRGALSDHAALVVEFDVVG